jgi:hypothetical protein
MKTLRFAMLALVALLFVTGAKAQTTRVSANIPFDFVVGKQVMTAGNYMVSSLANNHSLSIRNTDQSEARLLLAGACQKLNPAEKTVLVFHRVGEQYFLSEIWVEGNTRGVSIPKSSIETEMAMNHQASQDVIVAALITR